MCKFNVFSLNTVVDLNTVVHPINIKLKSSANEFLMHNQQNPL